MSKIALGRGLGALILQAENSEESQKTYRTIPLEQIAPNPMQPRVDFTHEKLCELADSLKRDGLIQPLAVVKAESGYTIVAGERRYRAAIMAGIKEVPAIIMSDLDDTRLLELALVENIQRENLNPVELAEAYRRLINKCGLTQQQLSDRVGKSRATVANQLRLLTLPDKIKSLIRAGKLSIPGIQPHPKLPPAAFHPQVSGLGIETEIVTRSQQRLLIGLACLLPHLGHQRSAGVVDPMNPTVEPPTQAVQRIG